MCTQTHKMDVKQHKSNQCASTDDDVEGTKYR